MGNQHRWDFKHSHQDQQGLQQEVRIARKQMRLGLPQKGITWIPWHLRCVWCRLFIHLPEFVMLLPSAMLNRPDVISFATRLAFPIVLFERFWLRRNRWLIWTGRRRRRGGKETRWMRKRLRLLGRLHFDMLKFGLLQRFLPACPGCFSWLSEQCAG